MKGNIKSTYAWGLGSVLLLIVMVSACRYSFFRPSNLGQAQFEFTVWADTLKDSMLWGIPIVRVSDREATKASLLLLNNQEHLLPFQSLKNRRFHLLNLGDPLERFEEFLNYYSAFSSESHQEIETLNPMDFGIYHTVVVALNRPTSKSARIKQFLMEIDKLTEVVIVNFDEKEQLLPYASFSTLVQAHNNRLISQELSAQLLFGGIPAIAEAPDELLAEFGLPHRYNSEQIRLGYSVPEYVGISSDTLANISKIVQEGISNFAMPGCQVLVAKEGQVIYNETFGYHTYSRKKPVRKNDIYDLASITKVAATTLATMKLVDEDKINLENNLATYFEDPTYMPGIRKVYDTIPRYDYYAFLDSLSSNPEIVEYPEIDTVSIEDSLLLVGRWVMPPQKRMKSRVLEVKLRDLLTHTSGLQATLPIAHYQDRISRNFVNNTSDNQTLLPVANGLYLHQTYLDSLWNVAKGLRVRRDSNMYEYSCVNMVLMQHVIDSINQQNLGDFLHNNFYHELGMQTMGYNPLEIFPQEKLIPTSSDSWRGQLLCGTVHDPTAAMMGGISGNAGLFSNANDLAILGQMLLNDGNYGGKEFIRSETVSLFTQRHRGHRGFGFDMPPRHHQYIIAESAPYTTYGHTGFTGTAFWVDPENDLVFIFLSNRVHPSERNFKINELRIRQRIHQVIYDALKVPHRPVPKRIVPTRPALPMVAVN